MMKESGTFTATQEPPISEKSELHKRLDRASELHAEMHRGESLRDFIEFKNRKQNECSTKQAMPK